MIVICPSSVTVEYLGICLRHSWITESQRARMFLNLRGSTSELQVVTRRSEQASTHSGAGLNKHAHTDVLCHLWAGGLGVGSFFSCCLVC